MAEQQSGRHNPSLPSSGNASKADSKLRLVGTDGNVVIPDDARKSDSSPTIISKKAVKSLEGAITTSENLAGKNLYGQHLAHFELLEPIGVGGMAAVLRARDTQLDRFVALKVLPPETAVDEEVVDRFHQEARAAAKLDHANIAQVFFCGEDRGLHFIAFEFVEGDNLRTLVEKRGRLPVAEAVLYIIQVAAGLDHAASRGVVHRDIKPSNIIITPGGAAKLVDMGLARSLDPTDKGLTHSGMTLGTFDYISPEQALEPREADTRSDIYSLGCTFYHILTGQPPVPEGTAAKKLYHHQHVPPIDPRQLNPDVPDEVAAILMRMMAKDPEARYQKPAQLVQHLRQVAEKVGAGAEVTEGAMFLDAPLPGAPRFKPLLTVALAALALGVLLMLISLAPNPRGTNGYVAPGGPNTAGGDRPAAPADGDKGPIPPADRTIITVSVSNADHLKQAFDQGNQTASLDKDINWNTGAGMKFDFDAKKSQLGLKSSGDKAKTLRFKYQSTGEEDAAACLTLNLEAGCSVEFENIRFELAYSGSGSIPEAMIALRGQGKAKFKGCTFVVKGFPQRNLPTASADVENPRRLVASLLVTGEGKNHPEVKCESCYWEQGQAAVAADGPVKFDAKNCAFGFHFAQFLLRGNSPTDDTLQQNPISEISLHKCSAFVVNGPAVRIDGNYFVKLNVSNSIFSNPAANSREDAQLIRQKDGNNGLLVKYKGDKNVYHNLTNFWGWDGVVGEEYDEFLDRVRETGNDNGSTVLVLAVNPWAWTDEAALPGMLVERPSKAFQIRHLMREVRIHPSDKKAVGVEICAWGKQDDMPQLRGDTPAVPSVPISANQRIVDPDADEANPTPGVYASVADALKVENGGVIVIRPGKSGREVRMKGAAIDASASALTLKPYGDTRPVLVFADVASKRAFFQTKSSARLQFENLEFLLESDVSEPKLQTVVSLAGDGDCCFKNCVFTMRRPTDRGQPMSIVTFLNVKDDVDMNMPMANGKDPPKVKFTDCLVRGDGDLVHLRSSRAIDLSITNTILALAGSAVSLQGTGKGAGVPDAELRSVVRLSHVSAFLTEPFIRGKKLEGVIPVRCEALRDNLFVAMSAKPFLSLDIDNDQQRDILDWRGEKNCYVRYENIFESKRLDDAASTRIEKKEWIAAHDPDAYFSVAQFNMPPSPAFSGLSFDHFRPQPAFQEQLANFGANLDKRKTAE